jgi:hypothetical protein
MLELVAALEEHSHQMSVFELHMPDN